MPLKTKPTKAVLYARFSPRPNASECESCETQFADLRAHCNQEGIEVIAEFADKSVSGGDSWEKRPGLLDASVAAKRGMMLLVRSYDRLFRDADQALAFRAMMAAKGVVIQSISEESANGNSMIAKLLRYIFLWKAEYDREIIRARTKAKMLQHQDNGRRMSKELPWGWKPDPENPAKMVRCEEEEAIAKRMCTLRNEGLGLREIGRRLAEQGHMRRGKTTWPHQIIRRILQREGVA